MVVGAGVGGIYERNRGREGGVGDEGEMRRGKAEWEEKGERLHTRTRAHARTHMIKIKAQVERERG